MKKPFKPGQLLDQQNALTLYFDALLNEVDAAGDHTVLDSPNSGVDLASQTQASEEQAENRIDLSGTSSPAVSEEPVGVIRSAAPVATFEKPGKNTSDSTKSHKIDEQYEAPPWAIPRFQVLTFSVGNMQMAAPLDKLNGIIPFPGRLTVLPGQSHWFLGLARNRNKNVQVIDLATVIQPQHHLKSVDQDPAENTRYILLIDEGRWGIVCNSLSTVLTLEPQQVQWQRSSHVDFILGTVIETMHSVLSIEQVVNRLNGGQLV